MISFFSYCASGRFGDSLIRAQSAAHRQTHFNEVNILASDDFRLITLGRLAFEGGEDDPAAEALRRQRRKLAVLAVLALACEPLSRDALVDMFWGDQDETRARHSLSEALSHLRRVLGPHAITARGFEVALDERAPLRVDAREFRVATQAKSWASALALYGGPFLDAVHAGESARLEAWLDGERRALAALHLRACEAEYGRLRSEQQWEEAAVVARRWVDADPLAEAAALALLRALEAPGTAEADARALQEYETLRARLSRDYSTSPGPRVQGRAAVLAERVAHTSPAPSVAHTSPAPSAAQTSPAPSVAGAVSVTPPSAASVDREPSRRRHLRPAMVSAALALALAGLVGWRLWSAHSTPPAPAGMVAVVPFAVSGAGEYGYLREGIVDLLSADLDGAGPFRSADPQAVMVAVRNSRRGSAAEDARAAAARVGAGYYVTGDVVVAGGRLRISAALFALRGHAGPVARSNVEGSPDDLFELVDRLTARLLAGSGSAVPPLGRLAALTTASLPALKAYLQGENDFRRGFYASAFDAFRSAAQLDTSFALSHYRVAQAANWAVPPGWGWDSILVRSRMAAAHASRLAPRARLMVQAYAAWTAGSYDDAERGYRAVIRTYPDEVEAWYGLGEVLFHTNPVRGRPFVEAGEPFRRVLALEPNHQGAMTHLLRVLVRERQPAGVDSLVARLDALSAPPRTVEFHALRAFAFGDDAERDRAFEALRRTDDDEIVRVTANRVAIYAGDERAAARMVSFLLDRSLPPDVRAHALLWLAELEVAHGRWRAAEPYLSVAAVLNPAIALEEQALLAALPFAPAAVTRTAVAESALLRWDAAHTPPSSFPWLGVYNGLHAHLRVYLLGLLELRQGKTDAADRWAGELADLPGSHEAQELGRGLGESLRAHAADATGQATAALARFDAARLRVSEGLLESQIGSQSFERFARAELLFRLGRWRDALPWYASLAEISIDGLIYAAPARQRQGEIYEQLGERRAAAAHYARFLELWRDADPELAPVVRQARARLLALNADP